MNNKMMKRKQTLKRIKLVLGFIPSILLAIVACILASYQTSYWVFFVYAAMVALFLSGHRASKMLKEK
ncbi:hypothetical protein [Gracilibacillus phocaeensis]|uniref:hypothetical protein n=1 Tax=Gracilibacillus phocaeensis TaxID=2042304 RepID=UPI0010314087|nr:hypothetical protein [Gracilibacillus phocaeensis]